MNKAMKKRLILMAVLLTLVFGGLAGFSVFRNIMMAKFFAGMKPPPSPVSVVTGQSEPVPRTLEAVGTLEAVRQVTLSPEVAGRVKQIFFMAGANVKAGDPV
ncbi:MAG TPA: efflux transporter periplasmic adaptor subunit, partial [Alphaproteobacteria bacterium]|nr:efflux transporter periplasmic adaptor subunit [Alphaproteobacteria bacterium]